MKKVLTMWTTFLLVGGGFAFTQSTTWTTTEGYNIQFSGKGVDGIFKTFMATLSFDETNLKASNFSITILVASLNTGNAMQNKHATGAEWFDAARHPHIKFNSSSVEKTNTGFVAKGKLQVKDKIKDVSIPFTFTRSGSNGKFAASFIIKRSEYGVGGPNKDVADEIKVNVAVPVVRT